MSDNRPTILGQTHITRALADERFYALMPEFAQLRGKQTAVKQAVVAQGCPRCRKEHASINLFNEFIRIISSLSPDGITRLKAYLGVTQLLLNQIDPGTGQIKLLKI